MKKLLMVLFVSVLMMSCLTACAGNCKYADCSNKVVEGTDYYTYKEFAYCIDHKCEFEHCGYPKYDDDSEYCEGNYCATEEAIDETARDITDKIFAKD